MTPSCSAMSAFSVLNGEPGAYSASNPRSKRGFATVSLTKTRKLSEREDPERRFGL